MVSDPTGVCVSVYGRQTPGDGIGEEVVFTRKEFVGDPLEVTEEVGTSIGYKSYFR